GGSKAEFDNLSAAIVPIVTASSERAFLVVWSLRRTHLLAYRTYAAIVSDRGVIGNVRLLAATQAPVRVVRGVATPSGAAIAAEYAGAPLVFPLGARGRLVGPARRCRGASPIDIAAGADTLALLAAREENQTHAFRRLTQDGEPLGTWVCLDGETGLSAFAGG